MSSSRSSCSAIDITTFLIAMISLTMSRISSRAASVSSLDELRQVDRLDQRAEDRALGLVVFLGLRALRPAGAGAAGAPAALRRRRGGGRLGARAARRRRAAGAPRRRCGGRCAELRRAYRTCYSRASPRDRSSQLAQRDVTPCGEAGRAAAPSSELLRLLRSRCARSATRASVDEGLARSCRFGSISAIIWPLLAAVPNSCGIERDDRGRLAVRAPWRNRRPRSPAAWARRPC